MKWPLKYHESPAKILIEETNNMCCRWAIQEMYLATTYDMMFKTNWRFAAITVVYIVNPNGGGPADPDRGRQSDQMRAKQD